MEIEETFDVSRVFGDESWEIDFDFAIDGIDLVIHLDDFGREIDVELDEGVQAVSDHDADYAGHAIGYVWWKRERLFSGCGKGLS